MDRKVLQSASHYKAIYDKEELRLIEEMVVPESVIIGINENAKRGFVRWFHDKHPIEFVSYRAFLLAVYKVKPKLESLGFTVEQGDNDANPYVDITWQKVYDEG